MTETEDMAFRIAAQRKQIEQLTASTEKQKTEILRQHNEIGRLAHQADDQVAVIRRLQGFEFRCTQLQNENTELKAQVYDLTKWPKQYPVIITVNRGIAEVAAKPAGTRVLVIDYDYDGVEVDGPYVCTDEPAERFMLPTEEIAKIIEQYDKQ